MQPHLNHFGPVEMFEPLGGRQERLPELVGELNALPLDFDGDLSEPGEGQNRLDVYFPGFFGPKRKRRSGRHVRHQVRSRFLQRRHRRARAAVPPAADEKRAQKH